MLFLKRSSRVVGKGYSDAIPAIAAQNPTR